VIVVIVTEMIS